MNAFKFSVAGMLFSVLFFPLRSFAQDFTDIGKRRPFLISGSAGAQASTRLSTQQGISDPFSYALNVQLTPSLYGFSMPVSLTFADSRLSYTQPFSRYSFQPTYKWVTAYLGRTSMDMHPYGLSGRQFDGAGISLQPQNFPLKFMAMYGRFAKANADTSHAENSFQPVPSYKQSGYAFKLDFEHKNQKIGMHFFSAHDHKNSLPDWAAQGKFPAANSVLALDFSFNLYEDLRFFGQGALSAYTADIRNEKPVFKNRGSSALSTAVKAGVSYKWINLAYERIDPSYQSMGAYYFNQDFENLVLGFQYAWPFMDIKADIGWQHDDLKNSGTHRVDRLVGSGFLNVRINEHFNTNASYSNFTAYTQVKPVDLTAPDDPLVQDFDTVPYRQISQQAQWAFSYRTSSGAKYAQDAGVDVSYQSSRLSLLKNYNDYIYANVRHSIVLPQEWRLQTNFAFSTCLSRVADAARELRYGIGPSVAVSKPFLEKTLQFTASCSYYLDMLDKRVQNGVFGFRSGVDYTLLKQHRFALQVSTRLSPKFSEFQAQVSYNYTFSTDPFKKNKKKS